MKLHATLNAIFLLSFVSSVSMEQPTTQTNRLTRFLLPFAQQVGFKEGEYKIPDLADTIIFQKISDSRLSFRLTLEPNFKLAEHDGIALSLAKKNTIVTALGIAPSNLQEYQVNYSDGYVTAKYLHTVFFPGYVIVQLFGSIDKKEQKNFNSLYEKFYNVPA